VPDVVIDGTTGLLAPPDDESAFAARVRALLTDPARRDAMGAAAARFVASERGVDVAAQRLARAFAALREPRG